MVTCPNGWREVTLEEICVPNGLVRGPFGGSLKKDMFVKQGNKVYEQRNAIYKSVKIGNYYITDEKYNELSRFALKANDFIVSCSGTIGKIYKIPHDYQKGIINQALLKITIYESDYDLDYFYNYFEWDKFQEKIIDNTQGGAMKNLVAMDVFRNTLVLMPKDPKEQKAIASVLSDLDEYIDNLTELIEKKKAIRDGALEDLVISRTRLDGFDGEWETVAFNDVIMPKARIGWQGLKKDEYLTSGYSYLIGGTDFQSGTINLSDISYVTKDRYKMDSNIQVEQDDVLVTKDGTIGKVALVPAINKPATLNSGVFVFKTNARLKSIFLFRVLMSSVFRDFIALLSAGSTIKHLYQKDLKNFEFKIPVDIEEQKAIASVLTSMDEEIESLEVEKQKMIQIREGAMDDLLTGRVRLKV